MPDTVLLVALKLRPELCSPPPLPPAVFPEIVLCSIVRSPLKWAAPPPRSPAELPEMFDRAMLSALLPDQ